MDNPLVQLDPGLFIWTIAVFLTLLLLLKRFAWGPLLAALEQRRAGIRKSLDDADRARKDLEQVQQESETIVRKARAEAETIVSTARADGAKLRDELRRQAQEEAQSILQNAERRIEQERDRALAQIRREAVDVSLMIASKLIRRNLTKEDNDALIDDALEQVGPRQVQ